nr:FtsX-like permease family protein [Saprospiraceae bacterium]
VVNESAVKALGFSTPEAVLGREVTIGIDYVSPPIVGVVRDFHTGSLHEKVGPVALMPYAGFKNNLGLLLDPGAANAGTLAAVEKIWKGVYPDALFESAFLDEHIASLYGSERRTFRLFQFVALLALLINALGLVGLTAFMVEQKTKEIGVRKVLGASVFSITSLLTRDFLKLVLLALVVATPVAWWVMNKWLADFAYRIDIHWWVFALVGLSAVLIAFLTVGFQSVKAALANPVKSLRSE